MLLISDPNTKAVIQVDPQTDVVSGYIMSECSTLTPITGYINNKGHVEAIDQSGALYYFRNVNKQLTINSNKL